MCTISVILLTLNAALWTDFATRLENCVEWRKKMEIFNIYAMAGMFFSVAFWISCLMFFTRCTWGLYLIHGKDSMYFKEI